MGRKSNSKKARRDAGISGEGQKRRDWYNRRHERTAEAIRKAEEAALTASWNEWIWERAKVQLLAPPPPFKGEQTAGTCERDLLPNPGICQQRLKIRCREGAWSRLGRCAPTNAFTCHNGEILPDPWALRGPPLDDCLHGEPRPKRLQSGLLLAAMAGLFANDCLNPNPPSPRKNNP